MTKKPTVTTLQSGFNSTEVLNQNFEALRDAFDNTLSLDGSTPNAIEADLDLNGNNIIGATGLLINGTDYLADVEAAKAAALVAKSAAELAENNAETSEVNAANSATASASSATASASSATAAQTAQAAAELAETTALIVESAVGIAQTDAANSAAAALASETAAAASEAGVDADRVAAQAAAAAAAASESAAATSETNAATSETNAATSAGEAEDFRDTSALNAAISGASATNAQIAATAAAASETAAATSETNAAASAATATTKASEASASATAAAVSAASIVGDVADAQAAATQSQDARDTANLHKLAAEAAATSATNTAAALTGFDLEAIAESKGVTAVDVFVYDTSKDSDGGAWRKRTQGTSWYNETLNTATRGSRREFPAVAVIVAESTKVTIYDGDDPSLPMWMVFYVGNNYAIFTLTINTISMSNGILVSGGPAYGMSIIDFLSDAVWFVGSASSGIFSNNISKRNSTSATLPSDKYGTIVNATVNDVAMTVLPNAPIDAATGLPVPTIAVATDGGLSVIKDDGTVWSPTGAGYEGQNKLALSKDNGILHSGRVAGYSPHCVNLNSNSDFATIRGGTDSYFREISIQDETLGYVIGDELRQIQSPSWSGYYQGNGLSLLSLDRSNLENSLVAIASSTYNTGWMPSDIKGAFLSDTDDTDLVGSGELVTNGTFDTDVSGWTLSELTGGTVGTFNFEGGTGRLTVVSGGAYPVISQTLTTEVGKRYSVSFSIVGGTTTNGYILRAGTTPLGYDNLNGSISNVATPIDISKSFVATSTTTYLTLGINSGQVGHYQDWDNITVKADDSDRSVNNRALLVNGTVTRSPVATGADLVAYSGFSSSNYLEQPYNSDLDFGTGDFCVMGWFNHTTSTNTQYMITRASTGSALFNVGMTSVNDLLFVLNGSIYARSSASAYSDGKWNHFVALRNASGTFIYLNGSLIANAGGGGVDVTDASAVLYIGDGPSTNPFYGSLALLRISATAPTSEQIKKIYEDEKVLFQENAQATLYGTSDAVTALAHDDATNLLHVGTSAGRSVFQGLRRVENTTAAVGTAISASNGLVVEE